MGPGPGHGPHANGAGSDPPGRAEGAHFYRPCAVREGSGGARAEALALAREIAGKSPDAIRAGKKLLEESWHAEPAHGLALEASLQGGLIGSPNQLEAVKSVFEERPAQYTDVA